MYTGEERDIPAEHIQSSLSFRKDWDKDQSPAVGVGKDFASDGDLTGEDTESEYEATRVTDPLVPDHNDQNWTKVNDFQSIVDALDESDAFESHERTETRVSIDDEDHPMYGSTVVETASYSAEGIRVDVIPDYSDPGTQRIVRATVVDRDVSGFEDSIDEYVDAVSEAEDVDSDYVEEISVDMEDPFYSVSREAATDGGYESDHRIPIGGMPSGDVSDPDYANDADIIP